MHLQSLDIIGFKSFATKTSLHFHRGVTAVVGPNGCGKSNILDAIRWVLGEQSAKALRGGEMADVIFSGTDTRQPYNMAEVSLTFADCEKELGVSWNELRITRRVYRDGKSEYLMNGTACRLKDIHELFMDTGIGRSAYSIMEQGKLDQILSSRPDDRRAIFEEAAGITKFKSQKKEALRKLEYTEANLLRVTDIIKEVKRQIGSLQRQAGKARRYQALMSDLRVLDTHLSHRTYQQLEKEINELTLSIQKLEEARTEHEEKIATQEQQAALVREQLDGMDRVMEQVRDQAQTLRNRIFSGENRLEMHRERQVELQTMIARAKEERETCTTRSSEHQKEITKTEAELQELLEKLSIEEKLLQEETERGHKLQQERAAAERVLDGSLRQLRQIEHRLMELRGKISIEVDRRERTEQQLEQVQSRQEIMKVELLQLEQRIIEVKETSTRSQEALGQARQEEEAAQRFYEAAQNERQQKDQEWNATSKQLTERESKRELLSQLEREGEGLGEGTQAVLRGLGRPDFFQPGIVGTLASLLTVPKEEIPAIEAALGAASKAVVFKDADMAEAALKILQSAAQGRASLLVASQEELILKTEDQSLPPEGIWASTLISASEPVRLVAAKLLEGIVIVDTIEAAFRLKHLHPALGFATRTGEFIARDGVIYGGKEETVSTSGLLRRSQIASLEKEIANLRLEETQLNEAREAAIINASEAALRLKEVRERLNQAQLVCSSTQSEERLAAREWQEATQRQEGLKKEQIHFENQLIGFQKQHALNQEEQDRLTLEVEKFTEERSVAESQVASFRELEREASTALAEIRLRVATERQRQQALRQQRDPLQARLQELVLAIAHHEKDLQEKEARVNQLTLESEELGKSIVKWKEEELEINRQMGDLMKERTDFQEKREVLEATLKSERKALFQLQERRSQEEVRMTELRLRAESLSENAQRRYQVDLSHFKTDSYLLLKVVTTRNISSIATDQTHESGEGIASTGEANNQEGILGPTPLEEIPWQKIEASVAELSERVEAMGPVNLEAIAEYEELEERYTFLEQQNNDLINGKKELLETIARINKTTSELFATSFEQIRKNFQETFTELFGGGKANLLLVDDADPLESGIEIIARPPGKQLQSISLLSGGERTMAAVALLFAIYMVKPSPFCVLDEMDAPLDESNIGRFIKLLDRFVDQSQFFVITHNKRTMSRADTLYGVTMEEQGVTKLISVKFSGKEEPKSTQEVIASNES